MNVGNSQTYKNARVQTTEWEDILVKKGIVSEREEVTLQREMDKERASRTEVEAPSMEDQLNDMSLGDLNDAEDDFDGDTLDTIRRRRIAQLKQQAKAERFTGEVLPIVRADFVRDVTESSKENWVVCELYQGFESSVLMSQLLRQVARRQCTIKFVRIRSTDCVENWPDERVPCLLLYHGGAMKTELVGLAHCGGEKATDETLEKSLLATMRVYEKVPSMYDVENSDDDDDDGYAGGNVSFSKGGDEEDDYGLD